MQILRRLPFRDSASTVEIAGEILPIRAYQIVVWIGLSVRETLEIAQPFPAVLDTGHNHNFSIQEGHLLCWAGIRADDLPKRGAILVNRQEVPLRGIYLWIYRNRPGTAELLPRPVPLVLEEGISIYPERAANAPASNFRPAWPYAEPPPAGAEQHDRLTQLATCPYEKPYSPKS